MGDPLRKVLPGQELSVPAEAYNAFIDAARAVRDSRVRIDQFFQRQIRQSTIIKVRNQTGSDQDRFSVLGLGQPVISPATHLQNFQNQVALDGHVPDESQHIGKWVVLFEPLSAGAIGLAIAGGVAITQIDVQLESDSYCDIADGQTNLVSAPVGTGRILWRETGLGLKWSVIRIGTDHRNETFVAVLDEDLAASDGITATPATATLYRRNRTTNVLESTGQTATIWSFYATIITSGSKVLTSQDYYGDFWVSAVDCP